MGKNKAVFLDRDGTLCRWVHHINRLSDVYVYRKAVKALKELQSDGQYKLIIVSNQAAVAKAKLSEIKALEIQKKVESVFEDAGVLFDERYLCFDHPEAKIAKYKKESKYRKPLIGFAFQAKKVFDLDLKASYMIGDNVTDIEFGKKFGGKSILVKTGLGNSFLNNKENSSSPDFIANNMLDAVGFILDNK